MWLLRQEDGKIVETKKIRRYKDEEQHDETIDLEILTGLVGQEISYKNLCELLNWKYDTGNTKKAQMKALAKVVEYEIVGQKKGQKIKFIKLRKGLDLEYIKNQISGQDLDSLIMKSIVEQIYLKIKADKEFTLDDNWLVTNRELAYLIGLQTKEFDYIENDTGKYAYRRKYEPLIVKDTVDMSKDFIRRKIQKALKELSVGGCHLILWNPYAYRLVLDQVTHDSEDNVIIDKVEIFPSDNTIKWINKTVVPKVMHEMGVRSLKKLNSDNKLKKEFWNKVPEWIRHHCLDVHCINGEMEYKYDEEIRGLSSVKKVIRCHDISFDCEVIEDTYNDKQWQLTDEEREFLDDLFLALEVEEQITSGEVRIHTKTTLEKTLVNRHEKEVGLQEQDEYREKYWFRAEEEYVLTGKLVLTECHFNSNYRDYTARENEDGHAKIISKKKD